MDTQWQTETDQALNVLRAQIRSLRSFIYALLVMLLALGGLLAWKFNHDKGLGDPPRMIKLEDERGTLTLEPGSLHISTKGKQQAYVDLTPGSLAIAQGKGHFMLQLDDTHVMMNLSTQDNGNFWQIGPDDSSLVVSSRHDKTDSSITLHARDHQAQVITMGAVGNIYGDQPQQP